MIHRVTRTRTAAAFAVMSLALGAAACGGDDDAEPSSPPQTAATTTEAVSAPETTADDSADTTAPAPEPTDAPAAPSGDPIVIGVVSDTSGPSAPVSTVTQKGMELAVAQLNEAGGIGGRPVRLAEQSDGGDPTQTPVLLRKVVEEGAQAVLLTTGSASALGVKALCAELQVVCIHPTTPSGALPAAPDNEYMFTIPPTTSMQVAAYTEALNALGARTVAILEDNSPTIAGTNDGLQAGLEEAGFEIVARDAVPVGAIDASAEVARAASHSPDAFVVSSLGGQTEISIANALAEQAPDTPKIGKTSIPNQPATWSLANPGALSGMIYIQTIDLTNERTAQLAAELEEFVGDSFVAMSDYYAQGYDAVLLIKTAIESNPTDVLAGFTSISGYQPHFGQAGLTLSFTEDKHTAPDSLCGLVLRVFNDDNVLGDPWDAYQPTC